MATTTTQTTTIDIQFIDYGQYNDDTDAHTVTVYMKMTYMKQHIQQ